MLKSKPKKDKIPMVCLECGKRFWRKLGKYTYEVVCPKCHGIDTEIR